MGKKAELSIADQTTNETTARSRRPRLTTEEQREIARVYTDENASPAELRTRFGIGDSSLYRLLQKHGVTLRGRSASVPQARKAVGGRLGAANTSRGRARSGTGKVLPAAQVPLRSTKGASSQFRVTFSAVQIVRAANIRDALHHAEALGATDVLEINRRD